MSINAQDLRPSYDVSNSERDKADFWNTFSFELAGTTLLVYGSLASE